MKPKLYSTRLCPARCPHQVGGTDTPVSPPKQGCQI